jgi:hypothetical protein
VSCKLDANILDSDYIKSIFIFFKLLENPYSDETGFINLLRSSLIDIQNMDILKTNNYLYRENYVRRGNKLKLFDILRDLSALEAIGVEDVVSISRFVEKYLDVQMQFSQHNFLFGFSYFLKTFEIFDHVKAHASFEDMQDIYTLHHSIKSWSLYMRDLSLLKVLSKIDLYAKYGYRINRIQNSQVQG